MSLPHNKILVSYPEPWIAQITLNLPKKFNALSMELYRDLGALLRDIAEKPEILVTLLTGNGQFFSAGADFSGLVGSLENGETTRGFWYRKFAANNLDVTRSFYQHPKILITALNGPAIGLSAALVAHSDFIYATSSSYLFTPFTALGLTAEGASSATLVQRLGPAKANEALLLSKKITAEELLQSGFINGVYPAVDSAEFHGKVVAQIKEMFGDHLNRESILKTKEIIRAQFKETLDKQNLIEIYAGLERFVIGAPQEEFSKLASGEKKHKL